MQDVYTTERAGFAERLAKLAGSTTWREPVSGFGTAAGSVPDVHALAAALAMAARPGDPGPDLVFDVMCAAPRHRASVVKKTARLLDRELSRHPRAAFIDFASLLYACSCAYAALVGVRQDPVPVHGEVSSRHEELVSMALALMERLSEDAVRRAARAAR